MHADFPHARTVCANEGWVMSCRLDKDTTGLLLLTTVTKLVQKLTSPKHHVPKCYTAVLASQVGSEQQQDMVMPCMSEKLPSAPNTMQAC